MPRFHRPEFDKLPAYGLREDAFDDNLRNRLRPDPDEDVEDDDIEDHGIEDDADAGKYADAGIEEDAENEHDAYSPDPGVWMTNRRMSQTEVSLRLGCTLLKSGIIDSNVVATLAGYELTRTERPQFPVTRYLTERLGFAQKVNRPTKWRGHYSLPGATRRLVVTLDPADGHISVRLTTGRRLIVFVTAGLTDSKSGSTERTQIQKTIGRAVVWHGARTTDHLAICVPRSTHFRMALKEYRQAVWVRQLQIHLLTVARATERVGGLEALQTACGQG